MKIMDRLIVLTLLGVAIVAGLSYWNRPAPVHDVDTVYQQASAKAQAVADGTTKVVTKTKLIRDTFNIHDTVQVKEFVTVVDTLLVTCDRCAKQLKEFRRIADSLHTVDHDTIAALRARLAACGRHRAWWFGGGVAACAALRR